MTEIILLADNEQHKLPKSYRLYAVSKDIDEIIAIEKFLIFYGVVPERAYLWRNQLYVEVTECAK